MSSATPSGCFQPENLSDKEDVVGKDGSTSQRAGPRDHEPRAAALPAPNTLVYYYVWDQVGSVRLIANACGGEGGDPRLRALRSRDPRPRRGRPHRGEQPHPLRRARARFPHGHHQRHQQHGLHALQVLRSRHGALHEGRQHHGQRFEPPELEPLQLRARETPSGCEIPVDILGHPGLEVDPKRPIRDGLEAGSGIRPSVSCCNKERQRRTRRMATGPHWSVQAARLIPTTVGRLVCQVGR